MKYFSIQSTIINADIMNEDMMKEHMTYTQKAMDKGMILMSGLKKNMSGALFIMKAESSEEIEEYLNHEPFKVNGVQDYEVVEFEAHYFNKSPDEWFEKE